MLLRQRQPVFEALDIPRERPRSFSRGSGPDFSGPRDGAAPKKNRGRSPRDIHPEGSGPDFYFGAPPAAGGAFYWRPAAGQRPGAPAAPLPTRLRDAFVGQIFTVQSAQSPCQVAIVGSVIHQALFCDPIRIWADVCSDSALLLHLRDQGDMR
jgi:hypothetical protein